MIPSPLDVGTESVSTVAEPPQDPATLRPGPHGPPLGGVEAIEAYLKAHNAQGGTLVNINVISKEQVLDAHQHPDKYPDLVVRVTGYSAYFRSLSPEYRQQVVDRILAEER